MIESNFQNRLKAKQKLKEKKALKNSKTQNDKESSGSEMEEELEEIDLTEKIAPNTGKDSSGVKSEEAPDDKVTSSSNSITA